MHQGLVGVEVRINVILRGKSFSITATFSGWGKTQTDTGVLLLGRGFDSLIDGFL